MMKYNKIVKESDIKNTNTFLISCVCSIVLLLTMCYFGINSNIKGTAAASTCNGTIIGSYCCPSGYTAGVTSNGLCYSSQYNSSSSKCVTQVGSSQKGYYESYDWVCTGVAGTGSESSGYALYSCSSSFIDNCTTKGTSAVNSSCSLNFEGSGSVTGTIQTTTSGTTGCIVTAPSAPSKSGYKFVGWGSTGYIQPGMSVIDKDKATLPAVWEEVCAAGKYKNDGKCIPCPLNSYCRGGDNEPESCPPDRPYAPINSDSDTDCSAKSLSDSDLCWHCNGTWKWQTGSGSDCQYPDTSIKNPESCTAKNNNNIGHTCGQTNYGAWSEFSCNEEGHTWNSTSKCCSTSSGAGNNDTPSGGGGGTTVTKTFKATFDANGGTLNGSSSKSCSTSGNSCNITDLPTASKDGYVFKGWGTSSSCTSGSTSSLTLDAHSTYYACYTSNSTGGNGNVEENPSTGEITIALVWFFGIFALAYSVVYFRDVKEK